MSQNPAAATSVLVESVVPLTPAEEATLQAILAPSYPNPSITYQLNPLLIGGLKISLGGHVIDNSLQARLNTIYQDLLTHAV